MKRLYNFFILFFTTFLITGCSHKITFVKVDQNFHAKSKKIMQLEQRYKEYWDYFSKKNFEKSYYYELPHQRFLHSLQWYKKFNQSNDQNYTTILKSINLVNDYTANVKSKYISSDKQTMFDFVDRWYLIDGKWYHVMKTSKFPFSLSID